MGSDIDGEATGNYSGWSVSLNGDGTIVAIGAPYNGSSAGHVRVYQFIDTFTATSQTHKIVASDAASADYFGIKVGISGNYAIVGASYDDDTATDSGSAYIYNVTTGAQVHKLTASDAAAGDAFGSALAIDGNYAIVGAYGNDDVPNDSGSAYIFNVITGAELHKLTASDAAADDYFGRSVAISGNYAIVGANLYDDGGSGSGSVISCGSSIFTTRLGGQKLV